MAISSAQFTISDLTDILQQATEPLNPVDGMLWRNTVNNALMVYRASLPGWEVVADNLAVQGLIAALQNGTINSDAFNDLMDAAGALTDFASAASQAAWDNIARSLTFGNEGLTITNKGGDYATRLAPQQLEFWKGAGAAAVRFAIFGLLQTITSPTLQVGYASQSPRLQLGEGILEYQAATGNITCRKA